MKDPLALVCSCVCVWSLWSSLAKTSKLPPTAITFFMCITTALTAIIFMYAKRDMSVIHTGISIKPMLIIIFAGILNGVGMVIYGSLLSSGSGLDISKYVVMISCLMPVGTIIFARIILGEQISLQKMISVAIIITGVYMLQKS